MSPGWFLILLAGLELDLWIWRSAVQGRCLRSSEGIVHERAHIGEHLCRFIDIE